MTEQNNNCMKPDHISPPNFIHSYSELPQVFFSEQQPSPVKNPAMVQLNDDLAQSLHLNSHWLRTTEGLRTLAGNYIPPSAKPIATAYAGHQFGHWNPRLGDGRAILLGEMVNAKGVRVDFQLKGAGITPYSRSGDGRAPLGPVIREYIVSEAMAALNIPTTRSLAVISTGERVFREEVLPGGILSRIAKSHIRIGTFEYGASLGQLSHLKTLSDYTLHRLYPDCQNTEQPYLAMLQQMIERQAALIAQWQALGFIHGVMNTDNILLSGETVDYGPCAFLDNYDPNAVFSYIDQQGRYAFHNQAAIMHWNLSVFAQTLLPLLSASETEAIHKAQSALALFPDLYNRYYTEAMLKKIGFTKTSTTAKKLSDELLVLMQQETLDYTLTYRYLSQWLANKIGQTATSKGEDAYFKTLAASQALTHWLHNWTQHLNTTHGQLDNAFNTMITANPIYIPRNHLVEDALYQAVYKNNLAPFHRLINCLQKPYQMHPEHHYFASPPADAQKVTRTFCGT
ncbi:MAG: YdiU family protein [Cellvibrionaceae bacterium]|nr:YdiU family protein [Cellvibrionaceae bacterium]